MREKIVKGPRKDYQGTVLTTEEDELKLRKQRGIKEPITIEPLQVYSYPFDNYQVQSSTGVDYILEFRSLKDLHNSCSCPDFQVNALGTCKHIEKLVFMLSSKKGIEKKTSPFVEIFLNKSANNEVTIAWPQEVKNHSKLKSLLQPYFASDNTMIPNIDEGLALIQKALSEVSEEDRKKVRISEHLIAEVKEQEENDARKLSYQQFMDEVNDGKRSLQVLSATLYPYQIEGMLHLAFERRALLADEMGLGKTIQAIAACELLRRLNGIQRVLVITPASLKGEWEEQIAKFTDLATLIVHGDRAKRLEAYVKPSFFYIVNYEQVRSDFVEIQHLIKPDVIILDEAQRIKNWKTKTAWSVKQLKSPYAFILTGTPVENRIEELFSIMQMVNPEVLGPLFKFNRDYFEFNEKDKPVGYVNLDKLHKKLKPVLLRRLKKDVEEQLPERVVNNFFVEMSPEQKIRYDECEMQVSFLMRIMKKRPLTEEEQKKLQRLLSCMRILADTPYIMDKECKVCPKLEELKQVLADLLENEKNKFIIFSEWEGMLDLIREFIDDELKMDYAWHTGTVSQLDRRKDIKRFKEDPNCRFFLTTDSGSTGLNLQVANIVINMDLPWNPAKLEQRIARAWRKMQTRVVQVINFVSENTIEHRMLRVLEQKQNLASGVLDGLGELSKMEFASARKQVLEELEDIFSDQEKLEENTSQLEEMLPKESKQQKSLEELTDEAIYSFTDRIHRIEQYKHPVTGHETLFVVVDNLDHEIVPRMQELVSSTKASQEAGLQLEVLDSKTYELLKSLAKAGLLTINNDPVKILHQSTSSKHQQQTEKERRLRQAKDIFAKAERKLKMTLLLSSGGFIEEALAAAEETLSLGLDSYFALKQEKHQDGLQIQMRFQNRHEGFSDQEAQALISRMEEKMDFYEKEMIKFSLT